MIDQEKLANNPGLHNRLTQANELIGDGHHAVLMLSTKQTTSLIGHISPDETSLVSTATLPRYRDGFWVQADSSVTPSYIQLERALICLAWFLLTVLQFLSQTYGIRHRATLHWAEYALEQPSREAVVPDSYHPASLLSLGDSRQCTAATAVHWLGSLFESLRTVCTTVTFIALRAVHTTARFNLQKATNSSFKDLEGAFTTPVLAKSNHVLPPTATTPVSDQSEHAEILRGPPPLPPITTPPDEDSFELARIPNPASTCQRIDVKSATRQAITSLMHRLSTLKMRIGPPGLHNLAHVLTQF